MTGHVLMKRRRILAHALRDTRVTTVKQVCQSNIDFLKAITRYQTKYGSLSHIAVSGIAVLLW